MEYIISGHFSQAQFSLITSRDYHLITVVFWRLKTRKQANSVVILPSEFAFPTLEGSGSLPLAKSGVRGKLASKILSPDLYMETKIIFTYY